MAYFESPLSSSSSSYRHRWNYDVFLSFRGEDTRKNFTDHLYSALIQAGIRTFRDDNELPRGEEISPQLVRAIEGSRISVVVFSRNYASSGWCLDELVKIMKCRQKTHQVVLPIFYDMDPSDVRKQTGSYAKAFDEHEEHFKEEMEKVNRWREALTQAANLSGRVLDNETNGYEAELIKRVVSDVACKLGNKTLHVAKHPVGISSRVRGVISLLIGARNNVGIVGIYGIAGIGKTTIAKAVFSNLYLRFEGSSFLSDVKEISDKPTGLVELQERLLHDILKTNVWKISNVYEGMNLIKERLHRKKVLVVFDDVDKREQVEALMGERCWFGDGSKIIVVTKNKHLLTEVEVDGMYHAMELDRDQSLQLFSLHAFRETRPAKDYEELSEKVVDYCKGLPLALKILGSHLSIRDKAGWEIDIAHWRNIPHDDIQAKLRMEGALPSSVEDDVNFTLNQLELDTLMSELSSSPAEEVPVNQSSMFIVKDEEKKEEEKKEEKKEEKEEEKKDGEEEKAEDDKKLEIKKNEYWPSKDFSEYAYAPEIFSDENQAPDIFSDENPNACSVM